MRVINQEAPTNSKTMSLQLLPRICVFGNYTVRANHSGTLKLAESRDQSAFNSKRKVQRSEKPNFYLTESSNDAR